MAVTGQIVVPTTTVSVTRNVVWSLAGQLVTDAAQDVIVCTSVEYTVDVVTGAVVDAA